MMLDTLSNMRDKEKFERPAEKTRERDSSESPAKVEKNSVKDSYSGSRQTIETSQTNNSRKYNEPVERERNTPKEQPQLAVPQKKTVSNNLFGDLGPSSGKR